MELRAALKEKKRIVIKVGTSTVTYAKTGNINLEKLEKFVRVLINLRNRGKEVIVVSSGAVGIGKNVFGITEKPTGSVKQACAAVGQGRLMMIYEKLFAEYSQITAQVLLTKESVYSKTCRVHARKTFEELLAMNVVPIVNANDAISVDEDSYGNFGDNDTMSADVAAHSCKAVAEVIRGALAKKGLEPDALILVEDTSREATLEMMRLKAYLDVLIPRGGASLIQSVVENSTVPVICDRLCAKGVEIRGDQTAQRMDKRIVPATESDWGCEYLDAIIYVIFGNGQIRE